MTGDPQALKELQQQMLSWLLEGDTLIRNAVTGTDKVPVDTRLDIYANAYRYRLIEALQDTFPALHTLLGDEDFFNLGIDYLDAWPSSHFSLRYFGHQMGHFLSISPAYQEQGVLSEMARFEWSLRSAFDAADAEVLGLDVLQHIAPDDWPGLQFTFHPSLQRQDMRFNVPQLWQAIEQDQPPIDIVENDYPLAWLIWRKELRTYYRSLPVDEAWALDAVCAGSDFSEICSGVCEWIDEQHAAVRVAGFIQNWLGEQLITDVKS